MENEQTFKEKNKYLLSNCVFAVKTIFKYAPVVSAVYAVTAITSGFFAPVSIYCLQKLIDSVTAYISGGTNVKQALLWGGLYVFALFGSEMFWFVQPKIGRFMNRKLRNTLSPDVVKKFTDVEYHNFEEQHFKDVVARVGNRPQQYIIYGTFLYIVETVRQSIRLIGTLTLFFAASLWIGIGAALIGIPIVVIESIVSEKHQRLLATATSDQRMAEYLQGLFSDKHSAYEIKIFGAKNYLLGLWHEFMNKIFSRHRKITKTNLKVAAIVSLLKIAYTSFAVMTLSIGFITGNISLGTIVSVIGALGTLFGIISGISNSFTDMTKNAVNVQYYKEFMSYPERKRNESSGIPSNADIVFDNVSFTYPNTEREILHNVSFMVQSGEKAALVGVNGAGKSTIIKLLCGLYKPDSGSILIGGKDITTLSQDDIRQAVSVVFQDYACYQMTLRENIALGDLSALHDDGKLSEALKRAGSDEVLSKGLDAHLGRLYEDGIDISRGQWQRIAVARAFLSRASFVILDEPTASLDPIAESRMYGAFSELLSERGTIIISHRLASAKMADKIIVIEGGEVVSAGSHNELMAEGGIYAVMFDEQSSWYRQDKNEFGEVRA